MCELFDLRPLNVGLDTNRVKAMSLKKVNTVVRRSGDTTSGNTSNRRDISCDSKSTRLVYQGMRGDDNLTL